MFYNLSIMYDFFLIILRNILFPVPPRIFNTSEPSMTVLINQPVTMLCSVEAEPPPIIVWLKDGQIINDLINPFISIVDDGQKLQLLRARESDRGQYSCKVSNIAGNDTRQFLLNVLGKIEIHIEL